MKDQEDNLGGCGTQGHSLSLDEKEILTGKAGNQKTKLFTSRLCLQLVSSPTFTTF